MSNTPASTAIKISSVIEAAWNHDADRLALALMSEPATASEIAAQADPSEAWTKGAVEKLLAALAQTNAGNAANADSEDLAPASSDSAACLGDDSTPVDLWAEIHRLRAAVKGPDGYASWQDAATDERIKRDAAEKANQSPALSESAACLDVLAERRRQVEQEGWTHEHDDNEHDSSSALARAAAAYAVYGGGTAAIQQAHDLWPFERKSFKPDGVWPHRRNLVKAGALILAEIERLDRQTRSAATTQRSGDES